MGIRRRGAVEVWDLDDVKLGSAGPPIRAFEMHPFQGTREEALAVLRKSNAQIDITADGRIRSMALPQNQTPDEIFACVACFPELEELTINYADVDDFRLQYLAGLSNLKRLVLHDTDISDEGLAILGRLTSLEHLDLSESRLVGWGFAHLTSLDNLTSLDLNRNWWLSGVALEQLDQLKRLERLDLSGNDRIHPEAFRHLARVSSLKSLNVEGTLFDDDAMQAIAKLPRLQTLELRDRHARHRSGGPQPGGKPRCDAEWPGSEGGRNRLAGWSRKTLLVLSTLAGCARQRPAQSGAHEGFGRSPCSPDQHARRRGRREITWRITRIGNSVHLGRSKIRLDDPRSPAASSSSNAARLCWRAGRSLGHDAAIGATGSPRSQSLQHSTRRAGVSRSPAQTPPAAAESADIER